MFGTSRKILILALFAIAALFAATPATAQHAGPSTPTSAGGCGAVAASTPAASHDHGTGATPEGTQVEFDLAYIDMMIPHHESVIALAEVALPTLTDQRLIDMANTIISTQQVEIDELQALRTSLYPDAAPVDVNNHEVLHTAFPTLLTWDMPMEEWANVMSADWQVKTFCASATPDLAFVQQVIPHHEMAVLSSQDALTLSTHPEVKAIAEKVIPAQTAEIDLLKQIETELTSATPAS